MIVPGRILIIDDVPNKKEKAKVKELIEALKEEGESVLFYPSIPATEACYENVRLLIVDLLLAGQDIDYSLEIIAAILDKLTNKTAFFVIAVWTKKSRINGDEIIQNIKRVFKDVTQKDLNAIILKPFGKEISTNQLIKKIKKELKAHPECALLFEVEASVENARDNALSDILSTAEIPLIIETLKEEAGGNALGRDIICLFLKVLSRHATATKDMQKCINAIIRKSAQINPSSYGHIYNLQSYYEVKEDECVWTGDVLRCNKKKDKYLIVISPACDFAQRKRRKMSHIQVIPAFRIDHENLLNREYIDKLKDRMNSKDSIQLQRDILTCNLPERHYSLVYLRDFQGKFYHLILDFQAATCLPFKTKESTLKKAGLARVCRIDMPLIHDLLQAYSRYSSRIGKASIPQSVLNSAKSKIKNRNS